MSTTTVGSIITSYVGDLGSILSTNLPTILTLAAAVFGLIVIVRLAKRFIAGR